MADVSSRYAHFFATKGESALAAEKTPRERSDLAAPTPPWQIGKRLRVDPRPLRDRIDAFNF